MKLSECIDLFSNTNYIVINSDIDLEGQILTLPDNCVLQLNGGLLYNGTISGNNVFVFGLPIESFRYDCKLSGTFFSNNPCLEWFGWYNGSKELDTYIARCLGAFKKVYLHNKYVVKGNAINLYGNGTIILKSDIDITYLYFDNGNICIDFNGFSINVENTITKKEDVDSKTIYFKNYKDNSLSGNNYIKGYSKIEYSKDALKHGSFNDKPTDIDVGFAYFCTDKQTSEGTTNGIMIYHKGDNVWVDALGRVVE